MVLPGTAWFIKKMKIIEHFTSENKEHWLDEMKKCDWGAGQNGVEDAVLYLAAAHTERFMIKVNVQI